MEARRDEAFIKKASDSLLSKMVVTEGGCWEFIGARDSGNYGVIGINYKSFRAHRLSYFVFKGDIPDGLLVMHKCDNPPCINPSHLEVGTARDNSLDRYAKFRPGKGRQTTHEEVITIRELYESGMSCADISINLDIRRSVVCNIVAGRTHRWLQ